MDVGVRPSDRAPRPGAAPPRAPAAPRPPLLYRPSMKLEVERLVLDLLFNRRLEEVEIAIYISEGLMIHSREVADRVPCADPTRKVA